MKKRMRMRDEIVGSSDGAEIDRQRRSVDLLIIGCEVSLWLGEQFHADLHRVFPRLRIVTMSANKLLGQLGQRLPIPQTSFPFHDGSLNLFDTPCLLISHSGGTFSTLGCCNLLKSFTPHIFAVTSDWDTQLTASIRLGAHGRSKKTMASYVLTTHVGFRPEASTICCGTAVDDPAAVPDALRARVRF